MRYHTISVARSLGSGGDQIARLVANDLGFRYVDKEIVIEAAHKAGVSPEVVATTEQTQPLLVRILEAMGRTGAAGMDAPGLVAWPSDLALIEGAPQRYEALIEQVIRETAAEKNAVIVGHGASIPLAGTAGVLRVFITASPAVRADRIARETATGAEEAWKAVEDSDKQRRDYLRRFYDVQEELPVHYDLVVNTDFLAINQAAAIVVGVARGGGSNKGR